MHRRQFTTSALLTAAGVVAGGAALRLASAAEPEKAPAPAASPPPVRDRICLFTDHLDDFGFTYAEVARQIAALKIAGPDLTVRPGGLVPPARVAEELPKAAAAFREAGLTIPMLSTALLSAADPTARPILSAMGQLGIRYYKLGSHHYHDLTKWEAELETRRKEVAGLVELGRPAGLHAGFHNHSGGAIGGALWDAWELLRPLDPAGVGLYFDPAHATIEGAKHAWKLNLQRAAPRVTMVAIKDFVWEKTARGWQTRWCPLGEGMVDWPEFFRQLARITFAGPLSVHIEYDPGGATRLERLEKSLAAAERDIAFLRGQLTKAHGK